MSGKNGRFSTYTPLLNCIYEEVVVEFFQKEDDDADDVLNRLRVFDQGIIDLKRMGFRRFELIPRSKNEINLMFSVVETGENIPTERPIDIDLSKDPIELSYFLRKAVNMIKEMDEKSYLVRRKDKWVYPMCRGRTLYRKIFI